MNRNMNALTGGKRICGTPKVGKLGSEIPTGYANAALLLDDIDSGFPNRRYRVIITSQPGGGAVLDVDENSAWKLTVPADGVYSGTETVEKYDDDYGLFSTSNTTYTFNVGNVVSADFIASYIIVSAVSKDFPATYNINEQVVKDFVAAYQISAAVAADFPSAYAIGGTVSQDFVAAYSLGGSVSQDFVALYTVGELDTWRVRIDPTGSLPPQGRAVVYIKTRA